MGWPVSSCGWTAPFLCYAEDERRGRCDCIVSDLSDSGVSARIRYGSSADNCTLTTAPSYTEEGRYTVYYEITYTYKNTGMTENGAAYIWLYNESVTEQEDSRSHTPDVSADSAAHNYVYLDTIAPTCSALGYDRYLCSVCGAVEKRSYVNATGHSYQSVVIREADCGHEGKVLELCRSCGEAMETVTPKGGHSYRTYTVSAACTSPGYTVRECSICEDRQITDITAVMGHSFGACVTVPTCTEGGYTVYSCIRCYDEYVSDITTPLDHDWKAPVLLADSTCSSEGVKVYDCSRCSAHYYEAVSASGHNPGHAASCLNPQICLDCGAVLAPATGHTYKADVTAPTCTKLGYTAYTCDSCGESYRSDYVEMLGHDHVADITMPTCTKSGYTTYACSHCGDSYVTDLTDPLGHDWDKGVKVTDGTCSSEGVIEHRCTRCNERRLETASAKGHKPGPAATCTEAQICLDCGAVIEKAHGHGYDATVTAPTCTRMGFTTHTCDLCGDTYKDEYTDATGHTPGGWVIDEEPTAGSEGRRHRECENCGEVLNSESIDRLKKQDTTDGNGEATVGGYLVIVTDTDTGFFLMGAVVSLRQNNSLSVRLPDGRLLDYAEQTTVTVLSKVDRSAVPGVEIAVTDKNGNYCADATDQAGQITVPGTSGRIGSDGKTTVGWEDEDGSRITVRVEDFETKRPIVDAGISIGKTGHINVTLPDGVDMDENNRVTVIVTDHKRTPQEVTVIVRSDLGRVERGKTDVDGRLTVPVEAIFQRHGAYIVGYPDGTFGPEYSMMRSEAAAILARLLAERKGETILDTAPTKYKDVPAGAWYSGYVRYLTNYGVIFGTRAEFVTMAVRFFNVYGDGNAEIMGQYAGFTDVSDGYWAAEYIRDAAVRGWIYGYGDGTFRAAANITRAEAVAIVNRLLGRAANADYIDTNLRKLNTFTDITAEHWAYYDVLESANDHIAVFDPEESWTR